MWKWSLPFAKKKSFGIDLGNTNTLVSDGIKLLIDQPSYVVLDQSTSIVKAVGVEAFNMFEKSHALLKPVKPLKGGVIADDASAAKMVAALIRQAQGGTTFFGAYENIVAGVPFHTTAVERRALKAVLEQFNASHVYLVYEPLAAALGMGLDITEPEGKMIVDIGGGVTEIVIISLSGIASFQALKVAGDSMDEDIQQYFRSHYNMAIGLKTAEQVKIRIGAAMENLADAPSPMSVSGKDLLRGVPTAKTVEYGEISRILDKSISAIESAIIQTLEKCSPELAADIYDAGVYLTGGNALLKGLPERLQRKLKLPVLVDPTALYSVSKGVARTLREPQKFSAVLFQ